MFKALAAILMVLSLLLQGGRQTVVVPIQNPSFEQSSTLRTDMCGLRHDAVPGWDSAVIPGSGGSSGVLKLTNPNPCRIAVPPPDGSNVAFVQNSTISQDSGVKASDLQATSRDGVYTLKFFVANYFTVYPGYYEAKISLGPAHELCSADGWATQKFTQITLVCPSPGYLVFDQWPDGSAFDANAHLTISLSSASNWTLIFDNVSLSFTPGP